MLVDSLIDSLVVKRELRIDDYSLPSFVLHNSLRGSHQSSSAYIVSISILEMVTRSISITINTDFAQVNGTGLGGERTPLLNHPKKNSSFLDFA